MNRFVLKWKYQDWSKIILAGENGIVLDAANVSLLCVFCQFRNRSSQREKTEIPRIELMGSVFRTCIFTEIN